MRVLREFRDFAMRGNVVDMGVGIVIGSAFTLVVRTLVDRVVMPPLGLLTSGVDFSDLKLVLKPAKQESETVEGVTKLVTTSPEVAVYYGELVSVVFSFVIVAFVLFLVVRGMNTAKRRFEEEPEAAPPAAVPEDVQLLREIRDLLAADGRGGGK